MSGKITSTSLFALCGNFGVTTDRKLSSLRSKNIWSVSGSGRTATITPSTTPASGNIAINSTFINQYYLNPTPATLTYTSSQAVTVPASRPTITVYDVSLRGGGGGGASGAGGYGGDFFGSGARGGGGGGGGGSGGIASYEGDLWSSKTISNVVVGGGGTGGGRTGGNGNGGGSGGGTSVDNGVSIWYSVVGGGGGNGGVGGSGGGGGTAGTPSGGSGSSGANQYDGGGGAGGAGGTAGGAAGGAGGAGGFGYPYNSGSSVAGSNGSGGSVTIKLYYV